MPITTETVHAIACDDCGTAFAPDPMGPYRFADAQAGAALARSLGWVVVAGEEAWLDPTITERVACPPCTMARLAADEADMTWPADGADATAVTDSAAYLAMIDPAEGGAR